MVYVFIGIGCGFIGVIMKYFNKINLAIEIIKASEQSLKDLKELRIVPLITLFFNFLTTAILIFLLIMVWSAGNRV
jgi:H+/Cl- antiporter ClcA